MAITSHAFGRVTLTGDDAAKFKRQVKYGRPSEAAKQSVKSGLALAREMKAKGNVTLKLSRKQQAVSG
ncbi:hypothetical protein [Thalassovita aquimarina]|uniref:Uncharacterized protein n=1 Tax=Thalassovita aquimarina TaxID=2785917 RepID=A0ABS5HTV0_9RHOB|nr:hypothetical protein [Thalassovita aquimarina]MBR9652319.1 hypothetical protein [Thalassovita aquimarina]